MGIRADGNCSEEKNLYPYFKVAHPHSVIKYK
jgi:hypothetical protein